MLLQIICVPATIYPNCYDGNLVYHNSHLIFIPRGEPYVHRCTYTNLLFRSPLCLGTPGEASPGEIYSIGVDAPLSTRASCRCTGLWRDDLGYVNNIEAYLGRLIGIRAWKSTMANAASTWR